MKISGPILYCGFIDKKPYVLFTTLLKNCGDLGIDLNAKELQIGHNGEPIIVTGYIEKEDYKVENGRVEAEKFGLNRIHAYDFLCLLALYNRLDVASKESVGNLAVTFILFLREEENGQTDPEEHVEVNPTFDSEF